MTTTGIQSSASAPTSQPTSTERVRPKPPTVQEINDLDRFGGPLKICFPGGPTNSDSSSSEIAVPDDVTFVIVGYVVRISDPIELRAALRNLINLQRISKGMRRAGRRLMQESDEEEWKLRAVCRDGFILTHLHGYDESEVKLKAKQEFELARWGITAKQAKDLFDAKKAKARAADQLQVKVLSECTDPDKKFWKVADFDSHGIPDREDWLAKAAKVTALQIDRWRGDPAQLLLALAPQLEELDMKAAAPGTLPMAWLPTLFNALQAGKILSLGLSAMPARPLHMRVLAEYLCILSRLEMLTIRVAVPPDAKDPSWTTELFAAIKALPKLQGLKIIVSGASFDETHKAALLEELRCLARNSPTVMGITAMRFPGEEQLEDPEVCKSLAEKYCYAPKAAAPAQPRQSQS